MKLLLLSFVVVTMSLITTLGMGQSNSEPAAKMPIHDTMSMKSSMNQQNMENIGQLMMKMSDTIKKHNMTDEQQVECARIMNKLAKIMMAYAADVKLNAVDKHKNEIKETTKEWNYFETRHYKYEGN